MAIWKRIREMKKDVSEEDEEKMSKLEKGDFFALWFSAMITLWLPCLLILVAMCAFVYFLFCGF